MHNETGGRCTSGTCYACGVIERQHGRPRQLLSGQRRTIYHTKNATSIVITEMAKPGPGPTTDKRCLMPIRCSRSPSPSFSTISSWTVINSLGNSEDEGGDKKDDNKDQDSLDGLDLHPTAFGSREDVSQQYSPCKQDGTQESSAKEDCDVVFGKGLEGKGTGEAQQPWYMSERMQTIWEWSLFIHLPEVILFLSLSSGIIPSDLADVISDGEHVALPSKCNTRHSSERGVFCRPIPVHGAARQVRKLEGILLVLAAKGEQLSVRREREDRDGCDELLEATCGFRVRLDRVDARLVCREELGTVVDVRDTAVRADSDPPVVAKASRTLVATERDDNAADAALVVPDAEELSLFHAVLANLAASSQNREAVARAPPRKVRDTVTAVEARCGDPLP
ncbi:hypothetical protein BN1723_016016 [Verticillium longisporum]|uniref:Uncharacterized protein n=1 Tax=Verticillium longisporum TaxID=100787 RepID=A0A0G4N787_VERLO|nr:hypothetical protein BN1723_016016 [Verticillium longisporum]